MITKKNIIIVLFGLCGAFGLIVVTIRLMADKAPETEEAQTTSSNKLNSGDIIFQTSKSSQSKAIQLATKSKYSHMGIIYETDGELYVYEAIQPVTLTKLDKWIKRGENSHYVVFLSQRSLASDSAISLF